MTSLATFPLGQDQLDLFAQPDLTPLGQLHASDFEEACRAVATDDGIVNPNLVNAWLHARWGEIDPRWYSGQWASACSRSGFMDTLADIVQIDGTHSRGNSNKGVKLRRLRNVA